MITTQKQRRAGYSELRQSVWTPEQNTPERACSETLETTFSETRVFVIYTYY